MTTTFMETGLQPELLHAVADLGFTEPTPIQERTIPCILDLQHDLVALAQTGTGKTAAFGLPLIQLTDTKSRKVQSLILCPTRELCIQIGKDLKEYSKYTDGLKVVEVYGGASINTQIRALKAGCQMVVGTPGRVMDLMRRKVLKIQEIRYFVLDEADEMLNMGFKEDLDIILAETPAEKQTFLFSATMPPGIRNIAQKYMNSPEELAVGKRNSGATNVEHHYYAVHARDRYEALKRIADINPEIYGIVFCRTRKETKDVADKLINDGYQADALHGDLTQAQRDQVMGRFRQRNLQLLVATDVAARGLDVNDLTHVINYNLPDDPEAYVHRSGRTGRAGKSGISISIIHAREHGRIRDIERLTSVKFERKSVPDGKTICEKQLFRLIDRIEKVQVDETQIEHFLPAIYEKLNWLSREELIKRFVSIEFNQFLEYYKGAQDLNVNVKKGGGDKKNKGYSRFFVNIGSKNGLDPSSLMGLINESMKEMVDIGEIDIKKSFSFFEADSRHERSLIKSFQRTKFAEVPVNIELSKPPAYNGSEKKNGRNGKRRKRKYSGGRRK